MGFIALGLVIVVLLAQSYLMWRFLKRDIQQPSEQNDFSGFRLRKASKRPRVRDELAAWRQEQNEKYEWEAELKKKENKG